MLLAGGALACWALVVEEAPVTPVLCGGIPLTFGGIH